MSLIYLITNKINGKMYVGKTERTLLVRFNEHYKTSTTSRCKDRPLYRAFNKYGFDNFKIELIEEVDNKFSCEREVFWIAHYNTYQNGYNATKGADGRSYLDYENIIKTFLETKNVIKTSSICSCDDTSVRKVLRNSGIDLSLYPKTIHSLRKFSSVEISYIRNNPDNLSRRALALRFKVHHSAISDIVNRINYRDFE